jgi:hypothetical protein
MSSFKLLKRDCDHSRGFRNKDDRCVDCGAYPLPSVTIEHYHQELLKRWVSEQPAGDIAGASVNVPTFIMLSTRIMANEMFLDTQAKRALLDEKIVSLQ